MEVSVDAEEGLQEPLSVGLRRRLRRAVADHAHGGPGRIRPTVLHASTAARRPATFTIDPTEPADAGLRTDVVAALLRRAGVVGPGTDAEALVWLSRMGELVLEDEDAHWLAAARAACLEAEVPLRFVVVTRSGWWDPRSGLRRTWSRVR